MKNRNKNWKRRIKRTAMRTEGTVFQHIGASKGSGRMTKPVLQGTFGAASAVRVIFKDGKPAAGES